MTTTDKKINRVMEAAIAQVRAYLETELALSTRVQETHRGLIETLQLREMTSIIGITDGIELFIAFSLSNPLVDALYAQATEGLDIAPEEREEMRKAALAEIMNIVIGHSTTDLQDMSKGIINITPPNVLTLMKSIPRLHEAEFYQQSIETDLGALDIFLIGPKQLFSIDLEYVS